MYIDVKIVKLYIQEGLLTRPPFPPYMPYNIQSAYL